MRNKSKTASLICLIIGLVIVIFCIVGKGLEIFETYKTIFGVMLGIGSGLFGGGLGHLIDSYLVDKDPILKRKKDIEVNDERNVYITNKAKAKAFSVMEKVFPITIFIIILLDADFIITAIILSAYLLMHATYIYYLNKYLKQM